MKTASYLQVQTAIENGTLRINNSMTENIKLMLEKTAEVSKFAAAEIRFRVYKTNEQIDEINQIIIQLKDRKAMYVTYDDYSKKYSVYYDNHSYNLQNVTAHTIDQISNQYLKPNQIGVLSSKKLIDWMTYYDLVLAHLEKLSAENKNKIDLFLESIKDLPVDKRDKSGYYERNGLEFSYRIETEYVSTKIELRAKNHDLETFLQLADNKYKS